MSHFDKKKIHFIGIGGVGMSGIAHVAQEQGHSVSGSDLRESRYTNQLKDAGIRIFIGQRAENIPAVDPDIVVISTAIREDNPELKAAREAGIEIWHRAKMLAALGVGKSTLALTLAGLLEPLAGHVRVAESMVPPHRANDVSTWKSRDLLGRVGMVFQEPEHQFVTASVRDEVAVGPKSMGKTDEEAYRIADEILERMNLKRFGPANPFTLSGGEKRRLSVASMMAAAPKVVVMDEPTFGQDFTTWTEMVRLIADVRDAGSAVIMVTHDEALIEALDARRIVVSEEEQHD